MRNIHIVAKLGPMKKATQWIVYPPARTTNGESPRLIIQSDHRIAEFDPATGKGVLSKHVGHATFLHLTHFMGAIPVEVPPDIVAAAIAAQPHSGDQVARGLFVA